MDSSKTNIELLAPAKNADFGIEAIKHGADAVYIGAPAFTARAAATNTLADIGRLCRYAHLYRARVYIALNTLLFEQELEEARRLVFDLYETGVDALIVQDMALTLLDLPPICLHASTQCVINDVATARMLEQAGFSRLILARELDCDNIRRIRNATSIELEAFVHGALCVSLSGNCYLSHYCGGRSANRGECAQPCRLRYRLQDSSKELARGHLLSLKDMNRSDLLDRMLKAGITSFKIEGRLKDLDYVKNVTAHYRRLLDEHQNNTPGFCRASDGETELLFEPAAEKSFNRGFTIFQPPFADCASISSPASKGEYLGQVRQSGKGWVQIDPAPKDVLPGDGVFAPENIPPAGDFVKKVEHNKIFLQKDTLLTPKSPLYRNHDVRFSRILGNESARRRLALNIDILCHDDTITASAGDDYNLKVTITEDFSKNDPGRSPDAVQEALRRAFLKSGNEHVVCRKVSIAGKFRRFASAAELNALRRRLIDHYLTHRAQQHQRPCRLPAQDIDPLPADFAREGYLLNITNPLAAEFYRARGIFSQEAGFELHDKNKQRGKVLMQCTYCLRRELGLCSRITKRTATPLSLTREDGTALVLEFDCARCTMLVRSP